MPQGCIDGPCSAACPRCRRTPRSFSAELLSSRSASSMMATGWLDHRLSSRRDFLSSTLSFLDSSFPSVTGPHTALQSHLAQQSPLLPGLHSPGLLLSGLGDCSFCSPCGNLLPHSLATCHPLQHASAGKQSLATQGSSPWVPGFHVTSLPLALLPYLRCCSPNVHQSPQPGAQTAGASCAITELGHQGKES